MTALVAYTEIEGLFPWWRTLYSPLQLFEEQARAELLLWLEFLKLPSIEQLAYVMSPQEVATYIQGVWPHWEPLLQKRLQQRVPIQYLIGEAWFMGQPYFINPPCLIPRPETELLAEAVADYLNSLRLEGATSWEIGVGSGCLSLGLHHLLKPHLALSLYGSDICQHALALATRNAERYAIPLKLFEASLLEAYPTDLPMPQVILANLPYIDPALAASMEPEVLNHEAPHALFAEDEGFALIRELLHQIHHRQGNEWQGVLALEFGQGMETRLAHLLKANHFTPLRWIQDYAGITRHVLCQHSRA